MDLVNNNYGSSDEDDQVTSNVQNTSNGQSKSTVKINATPDTGYDDHSDRIYASQTATELTVNVPYDDLMRPMYGPENPVTDQRLSQQNILTGHVEQQAISESDFRQQLRTFETYGYARDPSLGSSNLSGQTGQGLLGTGYVGNLAAAAHMGGASIYDSVPKHLRPNKDLRKRRDKKGDLSIVEGENAYKGPWAGYEGEQEAKQFKKQLTEEEQQAAAAEGEEGKAVAIAGQESKPGKKERNRGMEHGTEKTTFHGASEFDYLGRTYMAVPQDVDVNLLGEAGSQECFVPKRCIHTWDGHAKGVSAIRFLPSSAHLLLSAGMDNKVKIWDVYHDRSLLRTYVGHTKAIRDIAFSNDGRRFLSASYDRNIKLWDTETGQCIRSFSTGKVPYCVTFNPDEDKQNIFLAGCSDKKIVQFDADSGEITQEYDQHLGAVNTITFVDDNRRFITTSDDKTMRAWEYDIPVVIKYIAEPDMHSMPAVTLHPNNKWMACQSLDNQIVVYGARDRFRMNRKKRFAGHLVAGYACKPGFSSDGRFISSGDSNGNVWTWDWKTCRILKKFKAHDKVVMNTIWHPHETSKMATCSWDGLIKYWD
ncbi:WD40-repeat-containing domain protein [Zychaea mexicana]|uniref:WD40-repeat-containing domain protein n=1 Tax=Zychaea mexicana TaxID=64656 RepID=UPI0022FDF5FF|nr:WD40-repeat-containing domain protein [Zychaea mexicana]KAI9496100.1 WD40-repeat-containing domain protein [Zychaea mexicana]